MTGRWLMAGSALLAAALAPGCTSRDERASAAAGLATEALQQGDLVGAGVQIRRALAARDDVSDYWLLSGRIALAGGRYADAYDAFESALALDRSNVEALTRLCQLAASSGQPERAQRYADQLAALRPGDGAALNIMAAIALGRGDQAKAAQLVGQVLAANPDDPTASITRSRLSSATGDYAAAAQAAEASLTAPGDPSGRLRVLRQAYWKLGDTAGYRRTVARLARAEPRTVATQIDYAQSLYDAGERAAAFATTRRLLAVLPGEVATADAVLGLWLAEGAAAMPVDAIVPAAAGAVAETRAAFAAYANGLGRPELALRALGDAGMADPPGTAVNDAKVARAQAQLLLGQRAAAAATIAAVLAADPDQPRALAMRGALKAAADDRRGAIEDLRHALSANPNSAAIRLALAEQQQAAGDGVLAAQTLADGLTNGSNSGRADGSLDNPRRPDARLLVRLDRLLRGQGRAAEAQALAAAYRRDHPFAPPLPS